MEGVQIAGDPEAIPSSLRTWLLLRTKSLYPGYPVREEPRLVFLLLSANSRSVGPPKPGPGPLFIIQGDTTVAEMHARQMSSNLSGGMVGWRCEPRCPPC
jgi:hypothetical protein